MNAKTRRAHSMRSLSFRGAIDSFILYLATEKGLSVNYQLSNRRSLQELATWCDARGLPDPGSVQTADLTDYLSSLKNRGLAPASLRIAIISIRLFFRFLWSRYGLKRDPAELLRTPRFKNPLLTLTFGTLKLFTHGAIHGPVRRGKKRRERKHLRLPESERGLE
jgi:site-specific recombinase XerD